MILSQTTVVKSRHTIWVAKFCLTPGAKHGADNGQLEPELVVLHPGRNLEGVVMEWVIKATGHNLQEGRAFVHEHVVDQTCAVTAHLQHICE